MDNPRNSSQQIPNIQPYSEIPPVSIKPISKHNLFLIIGATVLVLIAGVGGVILGKNLASQTNQQQETDLLTEIQTQTPSTPTNVIPTDSASPTITGWKKYQNQKYGYSIDYPATWFNLQNSGAPDTYKYFSTKDIGAPLEMGSDGIWVTLHVEQGSDYYEKIFNGKIGLVSSGDLGVTTKLADLTIDGQKAVKYISETQPGAPTDYSYVIAYAIKKNSSVYIIDFLTFNKDVADKNMQTYDQMATSFKFQTNDWIEYKNATYKFSINYPQEWVIKEYDSKSIKGVPMHGIGFGTVESIPGGMLWGVNVYDIVGSSSSQIEDLIKEIGNQFADRQEQREQIMIDGREATKVTVTTGQYKDWYSETIIFEGNNRIFSIGNGAVKDSRFEDFYQSFSSL